MSDMMNVNVLARAAIGTPEDIRWSRGVTWGVCNREEAQAQAREDAKQGWDESRTESQESGARVYHSGEQKSAFRSL